MSLPASDRVSLTPSSSSCENSALPFASQNFRYTLENPPKTLFVSLGGQVFEIHQDILRRTSGFFDEMLSSKELSSGSLNQDGLSSDRPLILDHHATPSQWAAYMNFMYPPHYSETRPPPTQETWIDLLAVSDKFQINGAAQQAREMLESGIPKPMSPTLKLHLGRKYGIQEWVDIGAFDVVHAPLASFSQQDYCLLGAPSIHILVSYHLRLSRHRQRLSLALPTQIGSHSPTCQDHRACGAAWLTTCDRLNTLIFRVPPATDAQVLETLYQFQKDPLSSCARMNTSCLSRLMQGCEKALSGGKDEQLATSVISALRNPKD